MLPIILGFLLSGITGGGAADISCNSASRFRTYDGSCNNLAHPEWGQTNAVFKRKMAPAYDGGDGNTPRMRSVTGSLLPDVRSISRLVHNQLDHTQNTFNVMMMQWGQFLDHDITHTKSMEATGCCNDPKILTTGYKHPDIANDGACDPIVITNRDPYFNTDNTRCMEFTRNVGVKDENGVRQQINELTPWIDASHIYGESKQKADWLRSNVDGKLRSKMIDGSEFLPEWNDTTQCFITKESEYCFQVGDIRVNQYAGLSVMHTVFLRYHNQVCDRLKATNPAWSDESLYQEARKIIGAVMQKISYDEFLLALLGRKFTQEAKLLSNSASRFGGNPFTYDSNQDLTFSNVFSTAAFRYGHSAIPDSLTVDGEVVPTGEMFKRSGIVLEHLDGIVKALISQPQQRVDIWYTEGVTNKLFEPPGKPGHGFDLAAMNIMRGRDHGLAPYVQWRHICGLSNVTSFDQVGNGGRPFDRVYTTVEDIDLYSGALSEHPGEGSWVGPLYRCILTEQFKDLKFADRFWYENQGDSNTAFTSGQISQIDKLKLAKVLCDTSAIKETPLNVFREADNNRNPLMKCDSLADIDIENYWID